MELLKGIPVSPGICVAPAFLLDTDEIRIPQRFIEADDVDAEIERLEVAVAEAQERIQRNIQQVGEKIGVGSQILEIHRQLLVDPVLQDEIEAGIRDKQYTVEHSVSRVINRYVNKFKGLDSEIIQERIHDLHDVERLLLSTLLGERMESLANLESEVVIVAQNLTPAQTAKLDPNLVRGFATEVGGKTSHTAIMARALGIPAVVGVDGLSKNVTGGARCVIDGFRGIIVVDPDDETLESYRKRAEDADRVAQRLRRQIALPPETLDGYEIELHANIELPQDVHSAVSLGASGVGLFRTEFIHLQNPRPDEEMHFQAYRKAMQELGDDSVLTLRTLDLGGDKFEERATIREQNPFLGCRSLRWCLQNPAIFRAQLRAILRASAFGRIRMMLPMVGSLGELGGALEIIDSVREELREEGQAFDENMPVGIMVEIPAAAIISDLFADRVDFFSVGTNDLIQYTLAVDRGNESVAELYDPVHPAVLRMLLQALRSGDEVGIPVSICGEMATEVNFIPLLIGLGFRSLSVSPQLVPEVKQVIRSIQVHEAQRLATRCIEARSGREIDEILAEWVRENLPDIEYPVALR